MALDAIDLALNAELAPYDDEEIQLMDTDLTNLQEEEKLLNTSTNTNDQEKQREENKDNNEDVKQNDKIPSLLVIEVCIYRKKLFRFCVYYKSNLFYYYF